MELKIHPEKRQMAVEFLRGYFACSPEAVLGIQKAAAADPEGWWIVQHFSWGMSVRNLLRSNGYGESDLGIENLDDHYVGLIEEALL